MKLLNKFGEVVSACGPVLRATVEVLGKEYRLEGDVNKTWLHVIDEDSRCETFVIDEDGDVIAEGGEWVTEGWSAADFSELTKVVEAVRK